MGSSSWMEDEVVTAKTTLRIRHANLTEVVYVEAECAILPPKADGLSARDVLESQGLV